MKKIYILILTLAVTSGQLANACTYYDFYQCGPPAGHLDPTNWGDNCGMTYVYWGDGWAPSCATDAITGGTTCTDPQTDPQGCIRDTEVTSDYCQPYYGQQKTPAQVTYPWGDTCYNG
jgi:hypothetical protein